MSKFHEVVSSLERGVIWSEFFQINESNNYLSASEDTKGLTPTSTAASSGDQAKPIESLEKVNFEWFTNLALKSFHQFIRTLKFVSALLLACHVTAATSPSSSSSSSSFCSSSSPIFRKTSSRVVMETPKLFTPTADPHCSNSPKSPARGRNQVGKKIL